MGEVDRTEQAWWAWSVGGGECTGAEQEQYMSFCGAASGR